VFDIKAIRDNPAWFDRGLARRGLEPLSAKVLALDEQRRAVVTKLQDAQSRRNAASKDIGKAKAQKDEVTASLLMAEVAALKDALAAGEADQTRLDAELQALLEVIPNIPRDDVPDGVDETGNREVRRWGEPTKLATNKPKQHFEIGEALGMMDFEAAAKVSGARFVFLKGPLARLERALGQFMLDLHTTEFGYTEVNPPMLVRDHAAYGTGNLPKFEEDLFQTTKFSSKHIRQLILGIENAGVEFFLQKLLVGHASIDVETYRKHEEPSIRRQIGEQLTTHGVHEFLDEAGRLYLTPTAEVPLTNLAREQIIDEATLPHRYTACTPCFRSEAGSAGRDTRGMIRQHQFTKVELVSITTPEQAIDEHERMTKAAETVLQRLGLPYRTMLLCTGDMGFASQKTYDIEVWLPGQNAYREISSCSVCGDFQARRMAARYRPTGAKDTRFVYTLNGSGLAVGRTLVAVLENYQQADGSVTIPDALRPYMGGIERIG
jgi:seryl-tRNA synthetase